MTKSKKSLIVSAMSKKKIANAIVTVPDYPIPGVQFRDITSLLADPELYRESMAMMIMWAQRQNFDAVVSIESRGFIFGPPVALELGVPLILARKPGKLPRATQSREYTLEYGTATIHITEGTLPKDSRVLIVDDVIATGGTALATAELCMNMGAKGVSIAALANLEALGGRQRLIGAGFPVFHIVDF